MDDAGRGARLDISTSVQAVPTRTRTAVSSSLLVALVVLGGCTASSDAGQQPGSDSASPSVATVDDRGVVTWSADEQELFDRATAAMTRFAEAAEVGDIDEAQTAAAEASSSMTRLATALDGETLPDAVDLRESLVECSSAYGAVDDALANADPEAFEEATSLFRACLDIATVEPP